MAIAIGFARGCLPCVVPSRATQPEFPPTCLAQAEKLAWQRTVPYQLRQRAALVLLLSHQPLVSNREAAQRVQRHPRSVRRWRHRWATGTLPWTTSRDGAARRIFPPLDHALVKVVACELVAETTQPLRRQSRADVTARVRTVLGTPISRSTVWRSLATDAITPWRYKYGIFPRDPPFADKAGPILDRYAGLWPGAPLGPKDHILSADEKPSLQARRRCHAALPAAPRRPACLENEYARGGALQYLAAWDVRRGDVMGRFTDDRDCTLWPAGQAGAG